MSRQQLPPGIRKVELKRRRNGRPDFVYEILVDVTQPGEKRKLYRSRKRADNDEPLRTEAMARAEKARIEHEVAIGTHVQKRRTTVEEAVASWLESKRGIKRSTKRGYEVWFRPLRQELGHIELQRLTKADIDLLIKRLLENDVPGCRREWTPRSINGLLGRFQAVVDDARKQGHVHKNVVELVDRLSQEKKEFRTLTQAQMFLVLEYPDRDRHLWALALYGLRRGEIAGLRWSDINFQERTLSIVQNKVTAGKDIFISTPKSKASRRTLPLPDELYDILVDAHSRIESPYVATHENGSELTPNNLSYRWGRLMLKLGINVEDEDVLDVRLHDARHTCATLMHLRGVPVAVIAAWLGHASAAFTLATYAHSQDEALKAAAFSLDR